MAIYEIPSYALQESTFSLSDGVVSSRYGDGSAVGLTEINDPVWRVVIRTPPLVQSTRDLWRAWKARLRGGLDQFSLYDITKPTPAAYPSATSAAAISSGWDGTASVTTLGASGVLTLGDLPSGYVISVDDYIGLEEGGRYDLYSVVTGATANGSGVAAPVVRPFLRTGTFTTAAVARLWRPLGVFVIEPGSWSDPGTGILSPSPISFSGTQRV